MKKWKPLFILLIASGIVSAQKGRFHLHKDTSDLTFSGTKINPYQQAIWLEYDSIFC